MKNPAELSDETILTLAQEVIRDPDHWTQNMLARNADGRGADVTSFAAVSFCSAGAIMRALGQDVFGSSRFQELWAHLCAHPLLSGPGSRYMCPADYNNRHNHAEVMAMFDFAREHARAGAAA
jgi:hypothetical protein